jgi:tetratricopeptide (TPR) repeat protein
MKCWVLVSVAALASFAQDDKLRQEYEEKKLASKQNAKGQYELGKWCDQKKLKEEAIKAYERALEIDPEFEPARKALGYKKVLGRWACEKDYKDTSWWAHPRVDQKKVDDAIVKGCDYLLNNSGRLPEVRHPHGKFRCEELVLLTLIQAGWDRKDPRFGGLLQRVISLPLDRTYHVVLKAMCLAETDPFKYQQILAQCAQFLTDNQCKNGQWTYGKNVPHMPPPGSYPTIKKGGPIPNINTGVQEESPDPKKKDNQPGQIEIKAGQSVGEETGDNSNSQYAALGLRACLSGLVVVPKETIQKAHDWWEKNQKSDGGWGYGAGPNGDSGMAQGEPSWGSMSAGALGSLVIYKYYLNRVWSDKQDWKGAPSITKGIGWMGSNMTFAENIKHPEINAWHHYWIYAIERAGRLLETEKFGSHEWYPEGAGWLLPRQQPDGSFQKEDWSRGGPMGGVMGGQKDGLLPGVITETCFAILFLRRATPKLDETIKIESGDVKNGRVVKPEK